jgi:hypothetical protein
VSFVIIMLSENEEILHTGTLHNLNSKTTHFLKMLPKHKFFDRYKVQQWSAMTLVTQQLKIEHTLLWPDWS